MSWRVGLLGLRLVLGIVAAGASALALSQTLSFVPWITFPAVSLALILLTVPLLLISRTELVDFLAGLYLVALAPAILSHSSVNWFRFLFPQPLSYSAPALSETIALGLLTSFCTLFIYLISRWQETSRHLMAHGVESNDQSTFLRGSLLVGFTVAGGAATLTTAGLLIPTGMTRVWDQIWGYIPWPLATLGLAGAALLAVLVFQAMLQRPSD